jgi:anti-sigma-K factor RskA
LSHEKPSEEIRELAALYALGALTQHEARSFETHIQEGCPVCEAEYRRFSHIAAEIGLAANEVEAPAYIREMILARIEREKQPKAPPAPPEKPKPAPKVVPTPSPRPMLTMAHVERPSIFPWILAAIFAVTAALAFWAYYSQQSDNNRLKQEITSVKTDLDDLQTLYDIQKGRRGELEQIISTVSKPETRILHLEGLAPAPSSSGAILWDVQQHKCLVFGFMPSPPQGKAYQLWFLTPSAKIPSGTLKPDPAGRIYDWFPIPEDIATMTMVITLEPSGGSQAPTLPYYAIGRNN